MAYGYFKAEVTDHEAVFHVTFRENPFGGQFTVACGLATAIDFLRGFHSPTRNSITLVRSGGMMTNRCSILVFSITCATVTDLRHRCNS